MMSIVFSNMLKTGLEDGIGVVGKVALTKSHIPFQKFCFNLLYDTNADPGIHVQLPPGMSADMLRMEKPIVKECSQGSWLKSHRLHMDLVFGVVDSM